MLKILAASLALFTAYKIGESKAKLQQLDFYITRVTGPSTGIHILEYAQITDQGLNFSQDSNQATILNYWDALSIKEMFKKFAPSSKIHLESVSTLTIN